MDVLQILITCSVPSTLFFFTLLPAYFDIYDSILIDGGCHKPTLDNLNLIRRNLGTEMTMKGKIWLNFF